MSSDIKVREGSLFNISALRLIKLPMLLGKVCSASTGPIFKLFKVELATLESFSIISLSSKQTPAICLSL
jgi:hypothetical protein